MKNCRICGGELNAPVYTSLGMSITSVRSVSDASLVVYMCQKCFHMQKPALQSMEDYYDQKYRISLESDDFDQLYDKVDGKCIYRTDYQAGLILDFVDVPSGARILDYGAGKASTLMKVATSRPDLIPYVFDVSDSYRQYWQVLPQEQQATYSIPESWKKKFSLIMTHFVLEHVEDPCCFFTEIASLLDENGLVFFTVPNLMTNPGDLIVVDHINHFSITSIREALQKADLSIVAINFSTFRGAIVCVAGRGKKAFSSVYSDHPDYVYELESIVHFWLNFDRHLDKTAEKYSSVSTAIFGAGVYGSYIATKIRNSVSLKCFLDNSTHLTESEHMGLPVLKPDDMPQDIRVIYSGLNPSIARIILAPLQKEGNAEVVFFDEGAFKND